MKIQLIIYIALCILCTNCDPNSQDDQHPNILLICVDDLRPDLNCYGAQHIISPHIDELAQDGVAFHRHYVNSPSCGPSRYTLLTGVYGQAGNNAIFKRAEKIAQGTETVHPSMPEWFKSHGYTTVSVGKVSHHPGGRGGKNWDDDSIIEMPNAWHKHIMPVAEWQHPRGMMHGLAHGEIRVVPKEMDVIQHAIGGDEIYPDGLITNEALTQLKDLATDTDKPFFLAVGLLKPHLPFGAPESYYKMYDNVKFPAIQHPDKPEGQTTWHKSGEFNQYNLMGKNPNDDALFADEVRRHYAACVSYADAQVGKMIAELKRTGADKNTIVVLWGDHGWHLGEHAIWGKHSLFEESLHSPLIISYPDMKTKGSTTNAMVETLDIFPTLCEIAGVDIPEFTQGISLMNIVDEPVIEGHNACAYHRKATSIRTNSHRLVLHEDGFAELYDHTTSEKESKNIAKSNPELVESLKVKLKNKLQKL